MLKPVDSSWAEKNRLLDLLLEADGLEASDGAGPIERIGPAPLSFQQQRLWFLEQLRPGLPLHHVGTAVRLAGPLDRRGLKAALRSLARRHEVLRTGFGMEGGEPHVRLLPEGDAEWRATESDLEGLPEGAREGESRRLAALWMRLPFDLSLPPLARAHLERHGAGEHRLLLVQHHLITDGWSTANLTRELIAFYEAWTRGADPQLPELARRYSDYAWGQRSDAAARRFDVDLEFWRARLAGAPELIELPYDRRRPAIEAPRGASLPIRLAPATSASIHRVAETCRATTFVVFAAGLAALLHRLGAGTDLVLGLPVANRPEAALEGVVGYFANLLPLRLDLSGDPTGVGLIALVRGATLDALDHQDVPFERLVEVLELERDPGRSPICQVTFSLLQTTLPGDSTTGLGIEILPTATGYSKFDLALGLREGAGELIGGVDYRTALWDPTTIKRWIASWQRLLASLADAPEKRLSELAVLGPVEAQQMLVEWGQRHGVPARSERIDELLDRQVESAPAVVAVVCGAFHLTYGELLLRADRLAGSLSDLGLPEGAVVALALARTVELCIGLAGVLRAGCAYLPIDPALPAARRGLLLREGGAAAAVFVSGGGVSEPGDPAEDMELPPGCRRVELGAALARCAPLRRRSYPAAAAAYVLFTSGSTGSPKGVVIPHSNVIDLLAACRLHIAAGTTDVWSMFHSFAFDFSVWELWGPLLSGGRVVIVPYWTSRSPESFDRLMAEERVSIASQTPSAFRQWAAVSGEADSLRWIVFGGEALEERDLDGWRRARKGRGPRLANLYGITETTVHSTFLDVTEPADLLPVGSRIGRPLDHLGVRVLDRAGRPVALSVPGEICIAGTGVATGYLGRPDLTAERFVPDPWGNPGGRLYRSGDLGRWRVEGDLEYLGRIDRQVKVRGHRIELGEVEAVLLAHPDLAAAVAGLVGSCDEARLVAWYVPRAGAATTVEQLSAFLSRSLPRPSVPGSLIALTALPLTANGKLDRGALPLPGGARPDLAAAYREPRTEAEEILAAIWARNLGVERVGIDDDFFALGGDSILSLRVRSQAEDRGLSFDLQRLFERPTIAALVESIDERSDEPGSDESIAPFGLLSEADRAALPAGLEDAYPLTAVQSGMLYYMGYRPQAIVYHNVYSFHFRSAYDPPAFRSSVRRAVARHPILRTGFDLGSFSEPLQLVSPHGEAVVRLLDLSALPNAGQEAVLDAFVEAEKRRPFDLARPPLIRFALHRRAADRFNFTFAECHPIFDGWSLHAFLGEVLETYFALIEDSRLPASPPLRLGVRDFVALERQAAEDRAAREFWAEGLRDCRILRLPRWREGPPAEGQRIRIQAYRVPEPTRIALEALARQAAVPQKSVLLAAHVKVMSLLAGERDLVTGLVTSGRPEGPDGDRVLGLFFSVLPFRFELADGSWEDLARAVFAAEREMLPFRRYPLARVQATQGGAQLFEVLFNYIHFHVLRDLLTSGRLTLLDGVRRWEETNYPLSVGFMKHPAGDRLDLWLRYDEQQFPAWQIRRMLDLYERALQAMAVSPEARHEELSLLDAAERHQLIREWGEGPAPPGGGELWPLRVARRAAIHPQSPAVIAADGEWTYGELLAAAHRVGNRLRRLGIGCEDAVGLIATRGRDAPLGLLGILTAGAAYVPSDPSHPRERIAEIFRAAGVKAIVGRRDGPIPADLFAAGVPLIDLGDPSLAAEPDRAPAVGILPASVAYVIFTSGSTGRPKGVAVEHRQIAAYTDGVIDRLGLTDCSTFAMASTFAADLGGTGLFPALALGGCLRVISEEQARDATEFESFCLSHPSDLLKIVPSHLAALLAAASPDRVLPACRLVLGGEMLDPLLVERVHAAGRCEVWNHYGPTEATVGVAAGQAPRAEAGRAAGPSVPLGRPLGAARLYVVDDGGFLVPWGSPGELAIGGPCLARGYLGDPAATASRFLPDALGGGSGERLYLTGDRVRHRPEGTLEFLGRRDHQVKIRGFRVELAEIEVALARHPAVREVAVGAVRDRLGEQRLVAYWAWAEDAAEPSDGDLRNFLRRFLPEPMLPSAWVRLPELPRTPNGKLDRAALPEPRDLVSSWHAAYLAPRSDLERTIAGVWREVLKVERVGVDDNFLDLGGHSLYMLRVHSKLREVLDPGLPMVALFEHPTVAALAKHLAGESPPPESEAAEERAQARHRAQSRRVDRRPTSAVGGGDR